MDGIFPKDKCCKLQMNNFLKSLNTQSSGPDKTWISTSFIRNRGLSTPVTKSYDDGYPDYLTNNSPASQLYVRIGQSKKDPSKVVFWINGYERPRLFLTKGKKYQFNVNTYKYPFYFTSDITGGNGNVNNLSYVIPASYYVQTFTINGKFTPKKFYYQSTLSKNMGGEIFII